ncbi:MAG: terminase small subunit [Synergistaceae bacterium]
MSLTQKQEEFCIEYVQCGNASEAYRRVYSVSNMKSSTVNRKAKGLLDNGKIGARLQELREEPVREAKITLLGHLTDLERLRDLAVQTGNLPAAISAEVARGKASGLYDTDKKIDVSGGISISVSYGDDDDSS